MAREGVRGIRGKAGQAADLPLQNFFVILCAFVVNLIPSHPQKAFADEHGLPADIHRRDRVRRPFNLNVD